MEIISKRAKRPELSGTGEQFLAQYEMQLRTEEDLAAATVRNYLSDLRHFVSWCESIWRRGREEKLVFLPERVTTPTLTSYRAYLQALQLKPNSINRSLISLKRYFAWLKTGGQLSYDPAKVVKLLGEEVTPPRHLTDREEQALVAAVKKKGTLRDQAIIVSMLHTGLRAQEVCTLTRAQVRLGKGSGSIIVHGKRNKYREVPLNATARAALLAYDPLLTKPHAQDITPLFRSEKRHERLWVEFHLVGVGTDPAEREALVQKFTVLTETAGAIFPVALPYSYAASSLATAVNTLLTEVEQNRQLLSQRVSFYPHHPGDPGKAGMSAEHKYPYTPPGALCTLSQGYRW